MKKAIAVVVSASCFSWLFAASALGTLYVSNLNQTPTGSALAGSDYWIAQSFSISLSDTNQYALDAIELRLNPATGDPRGFEISLYRAQSDVAPQEYLGSLSGSADPSAGGTYSFAASDIALSGGSIYHVLVTSAVPVAQGGYVWSASDSFTRNGSWAIRNVYYTSSDGSNWDRHVRAEVFQMAIHATVVPEPTTLSLLGPSAMRKAFRKAFYTAIAVGVPSILAGELRSMTMSIDRTVASGLFPRVFGVDKGQICPIIPAISHEKWPSQGFMGESGRHCICLKLRSENLTTTAGNLFQLPFQVYIPF